MFVMDQKLYYLHQCYNSQTNEKIIIYARNTIKEDSGRKD